MARSLAPPCDTGERGRGRTPLSALVALLLCASAPRLSAQAPPTARGTFEVPADAVWKATLETLEADGYKLHEQHPSKGIVSARRTRMVGRMNEEEATKELKEICRAEPHVGIDARGMSEYYVSITARMRTSEGRTDLGAAAKITAVFRRRGGAGAPLPVALRSSGFLEQELIQHVRDRLARQTPAPAPTAP